ncbi:MAG: hypothetical protein ACOCP4_03885 [Candidatus Woesearchaeota archaeon]
MRPHDIVVLLKIASKGDEKWLMKDLAAELEISASEVSESINRSVLAGLVSKDKKSLNKLSLLDFLNSGLQYVFPQQPGALMRGLETAHSAIPLKHQISSEETFVWPYAKGNVRGQAIEPLHPKVPIACLRDSKFYELIALADAIRVGKVRERKLALEMIKKRL